GGPARQGGLSRPQSERAELHGLCLPDESVVGGGGGYLPAVVPERLVRPRVDRGILDLRRLGSGKPVPRVREHAIPRLDRGIRSSTVILRLPPDSATTFPQLVRLRWQVTALPDSGFVARW